VRCSAICLLILTLCSFSSAEVLIPRGTRVRVAVPKAGSWTVQSSVSTGGTTVFAAGAPITGKGEAVQAIDGVPVALRCEEGQGPIRNCYTTEDHALIIGSRQSVEDTAQQRSSIVQSAGSDIGETSLTLVASDSGADVEMDRVYMGTAPLTMAVKPGRHRLVVRCGGRVWVKTVDVPSGAKLHVNADLRPQP